MNSTDKKTGATSSVTVATKLCSVCGGMIVWHRRLASIWDAVKYCSAVCRREDSLQGHRAAS